MCRVYKNSTRNGVVRHSIGWGSLPDNPKMKVGHLSIRGSPSAPFFIHLSEPFCSYNRFTNTTGSQIQQVHKYNRFTNTTGSQIPVNDYHNACDNNTIPSTSKTITGTINTGTDTISWDWAVPDTKSVGWFLPFCNNVYFEEIDFITRNITKGLSYTMKTDNQEAGNIIQTCNCGVDDGDFL